ncbi:SPOR domain-containing protein [Bordetella hinzii]|uniref:SPOR domain-containing protein n=2 Tax=Bordetella hinzii TaxID=103855 RepID=A0AAN1VFN7_9BORD|nr:SPOR domain-containing protein [Bordetella hinzii]AKQ57825.1 rare lipoprotein A [Bordetella hinzii]AKQ62291.1 rare lipoprotein A [Bordetella hinzii]AZW16810.1 SPOR domain-containing protein [Bordetella hinzii]KCB23981.1 sporulation and cell division repeat protein [Bordetella hinzii OH87 BAL007II]KCB29807.1 sporulation and cell division repeat protein [Bordetella hinzii CA90 BAL1384]
MASKRKSSSQGGSTLYGVLAGLLIGLILAAAVAFYVTKAPMPFVDRATRQASGPEKPIDPRTAPDPNQGLYGRDGAAGTPPTGPTATAPTPLPDGKTDDLGALIATLPSADQAAAPLPVPVPAAPAPSKPAAAAKPPEKTASIASTPPAQQANGNYYLQAGAYRVQADAESLRARILLLGLPVNVQRAEVNGVQVNRVRVGPFSRLDDMNRARSRLGENKIESTVVKQQ